MEQWDVSNYMSELLQWREVEDKGGLETWEARFTDEGDTRNIVWRVRFREWGNSESEWYADHDDDLGGNTGKTWPTLSAAQADIQRAHNRILENMVTPD